MPKAILLHGLMNAFVPMDYHPQAPVDEWSADCGCGVQYFSQQCVGRLLRPAGIEIASNLSLPERLKQVQKLMDQGDDARARKIYETIGVYLGTGSRILPIFMPGERSDSRTCDLRSRWRHHY